MREMAVYLEDAIDVHDRHWKIHWMLNFAQFASTTNLNAVIAEVRGGEDPGLMGRLQSSLEDRNWDSIEDLWKIKEEIKGDGELAAAFEGDTAPDVLRALEGSERGRRLIAERIEPHQRTFGNKAIWSHEFAFKTWREDPAPILEAVRGYLATDYDYPSNIASVRDDLEAAKREVMEGVDGEGREQLQQALDLSLGMNPLTPDHHFYVDQGTNARLRIVLIAIGRKLAERRRARRPRGRDVPPLQRAAAADGRPGRVRRAASWCPTAATRARTRPSGARPRGSAPPPRPRSTSPTTRCGASRTSSTRASRRPTGEVKGLAASPGVVEGPARFVASLDEFDQVRDGEILVCRMTNPAWVVLFTKIVGPGHRGRRRDLAPGGGGARVRHPGRGRHHQRRRADQDRRPDPGQRHDGRRRDPWLNRTGWRPPPSRRRSRCAPSAATRRPCSRAGRSWGSS